MFRVTLARGKQKFVGLKCFLSACCILVVLWLQLWFFQHKHFFLLNKNFAAGFFFCGNRKYFLCQRLGQLQPKQRCHQLPPGCWLDPKLGLHSSPLERGLTWPSSLREGYKISLVVLKGTLGFFREFPGLVEGWGGVGWIQAAVEIF